MLPSEPTNNFLRFRQRSKRPRPSYFPTFNLVLSFFHPKIYTSDDRQCLPLRSNSFYPKFNKIKFPCSFLSLLERPTLGRHKATVSVRYVLTTDFLLPTTNFQPGIRPGSWPAASSPLGPPSLGLNTSTLSQVFSLERSARVLACYNTKQAFLLLSELIFFLQKQHSS